MTRWLAYGMVEPYGGAQDDLRAGRVVEAVMASVGAKVRPGDVFPSLGGGTSIHPPRQRVSVTATLRAIAQLTGGRAVRRA